MTSQDTVPELITADDPAALACVLTGDVTVDHDYRPYTYRRGLGTRTSWRCVWCHVVACGDVGESDPCIEPYHHRTPHRSRKGITWQKGTNRPTP